MWCSSHGHLPACAQLNVARFLCQEGDSLAITQRTQAIRLSSPHIRCILATARKRKWRVFLQGGYRQLSIFLHQELHEESGPRVSMLHGAHIEFVLRQSKVTNPFWPLTLAFHYSRDNKTHKIAGRPLQIIVSFLPAAPKKTADDGITIYLWRRG